MFFLILHVYFIIIHYSTFLRKKRTGFISTFPGILLSAAGSSECTEFITGYTAGVNSNYFCLLEKHGKPVLIINYKEIPFEVQI